MLRSLRHLSGRLNLRRFGHKTPPVRCYSWVTLNISPIIRLHGAGKVGKINRAPANKLIAPFHFMRECMAATDLRSQEDASNAHREAAGVLLYPSAGRHLSEEIGLQGEVRIERLLSIPRVATSVSPRSSIKHRQCAPDRSS